MPESTPYTELPPPADLAPYVEAFWTIRAHVPEEDARPQLVLPDGCMDIIFDLTSSADVPAVAVGTMTTALAVDEVGEVHLFGIRFHPGALSAFLPARASELTDRSVALDDLSARTMVEPADRIREAISDSERVESLSSALRALRSRRGDRVDPLVMAASRRVAGSGGRTTVDALARATGLGRRQLERRFLESVGIGPKFACRVARFRQVVARVHEPDAGSLSEIAIRTGYADQAHMTRDFKALAGLPPGRYRDGLRGSGRDG